MEIEHFLLEDYKLKAQYLSNHFTRMLARSSFFLTIETGLLAFFASQGILLAEGRTQYFVLFLGVMAMGVTCIWIYFGGMDKYLAELYIGQVALAYYLLRTKPLKDGGLGNLASKEDVGEDVDEIYYHAGEPLRTESFTFNPEDEPKAKKIGKPYKFFSVRHSTTFMATVLPIVFLLFWAGTLILFFLLPASEGHQATPSRP